MPVVSWLRRWGLLLGGIVGVQGAVQACNALSGLLAVWVLPRETAYAWFTVASSMMVMVTLLADSGMTTAVQALGGPVWQDRVQFSQIVRAVQRHQRWLTGAAVLLVLPWLLVLLHHLRAPGWGMALAALLVAGFAWPSAAAQILANVNRLHSRLRSQLLAELCGAGVRLLLTGAFLALIWMLGGRSFLGTPVAAFLAVVAAASIAAFLYHYLVRREAAHLLDREAVETHDFDSRIRSVILATAMFMIYYGLQGQVSTWLMSLNGTSAQVADVGALNRLGPLFALAGAPLVQLAGPAFARCQERRKLQRQLLLSVGSFGLFAAVVLLLVTLLPAPVLWLLGPQYGHLGAELCLAALVPAVTGLSGIIWGLVLARGWVKSSALVVPVGLAAQITGLYFFDFTQVSGVLGFNLFIMVPVLLLACFITARGFSRWKTQSRNGRAEMGN